MGTFHWLGLPPVQAKARVWLGQEYSGGPLEFIPSAASRQLPPETDPAVVVIAGKPLPVEPSWQDFTLERPWIFRQLDPRAVAGRGRSRRRGPRGPSVVRDPNPWSRRRNQGHPPVTCHNSGCTIDNDRTVFDVRCGSLRSRRPTLDFCRPCLEPLAAWWAESQPWTTVATPASLFPSEVSA